MVCFSLAISACVLDRGPERRSEILPGRYEANGNSNSIYAVFNADGSFTSERRNGGTVVWQDSGHWEYQYVDPEKRFLVESNVKTRYFNSDGTYRDTFQGTHSFLIKASSPDQYVLDYEGGGGGPGFLVLLSLFQNTYVTFNRL